MPLPLGSFTGKHPYKMMLCETGVMPASVDAPIEDEPPPFLGSWQRVYCAVLIYLAVVITTLYLLTGLFRY